MNWFTSVLSGVYFVLYTGGVISFEYVKYKVKTIATTSTSPFNTMVKNIATRLSKKNIYYTKMFQALAYSSEMYDEDLAAFFIQYTDTVQYDKNEVDSEELDKLIMFAEKKGYTLTIQTQNQNNPETNTGYIYIPDKTGSVSLIFYGTLTNCDNNETLPIVVKCLRSNMLERIKWAINDFSYLIGILNWFPRFKHLYLHDILSEQKKMMLSQVNFHTEVENISKMYDNFQKTNTRIIKIPMVYKEFTDEFDTVIVMERLIGKKLDELSSDVKDAYCTILAKGLIKTVFLDGFYHCDMHPGNVLFIENENEEADSSNQSQSQPQTQNPKFQVGVLDFGIMSSITTHEQNISFELFKHVLKRDPNELARIFIDEYIEPCNQTISNSNNSNTYNRNHKIYADLSSVFNEILKDKTLTCFTAKDMCLLNYTLLKYNMKISKSLTNFEISLSVCDNLCKQIAFKRSYMDHLKEIVEDMFD
jgi:predicted unusual protein kinase regulating ubiquinone biosynthesis (AarF/ABC1/UbiB family)